MNFLGIDEQHALLKIVAERLERCGIPYMVAGSVAANSYAPARTTNDIDFVIKLGEADIDNLIKAFEQDFYINSHDAIRDAIRRCYPFNAIYLSSAAKIDLVPIKPDAFAQTEFNRRRIVVVNEDAFWYVTPEDYLISKLKTFVQTKSERQLTDLKNVLATQERNLDLEYMRVWADRLGLRDELEALL
jgi:hypothetical protein